MNIWKVLLYYWTKFYVISSLCKCVKIRRYHRQHLQSNDLRFMKFAPTLSICVCMIAFQSESGIGQNTSWCIKQYLNPPKKQTVFFFRLLHYMGGFQLEFVSISQVINHMTCYIFSALNGWNYSVQTGEQILYRILFLTSFPPMRALEFITGHVIYNPAYTYKFQLVFALSMWNNVEVYDNKT